MLIFRIIFIWFILLDSCHIVFMHEIEEKFFASNNRLKNRSLEAIISELSFTPRLGGGGGFGGLSYLAVSLLFQLPLMEIIFVMGLLILVLGIMLHFVELKADFFRLRRQFLREEKLRIQLEKEEELRNQTMALQGSQGSNSSIVNGLNGNPVNGLFNQNYGSDGSQSYVNYGNQENNRDYGQHYSDDKLYAQSSQSYPSHRLPPNRYLQSKRLLRRRLVNQLMRTQINSQIPQNINHQKLVRRRYPQRMVAFNRRHSIRPQLFRRRVGK